MLEVACLVRNLLQAVMAIVGMWADMWGFGDLTELSLQASFTPLDFVGFTLNDLAERPTATYNRRDNDTGTW